MLSNLVISYCLAEAVPCGTWIFLPRNVMAFSPMNGIASLAILSWGSTTSADELLMAREWHFGTLTFILDHWSHWLVVLRRCWQETGLLATMHESSAYWRRLVVCDGDRSYPRSERRFSVSTRVLMTVVDTAICIRKVQPAHSKRFVLLLGIM